MRQRDQLAFTHVCWRSRVLEHDPTSILQPFPRHSNSQLYSRLPIAPNANRNAQNDAPRSGGVYLRTTSWGRGRIVTERASVRVCVCMVHLCVKEKMMKGRKTRRKVRVSQSSNSGSRGGPIANLLLRRAGVIIHIYIEIYIYININIYIYTILYMHCTLLMIILKRCSIRLYESIIYDGPSVLQSQSVTGGMVIVLPAPLPLPRYITKQSINLILYEH